MLQHHCKRYGPAFETAKAGPVKTLSDSETEENKMKQYKVAIIGNGMICNAAHIPAYQAMGDKVRIVAAVSYTHLDVYKRQPFG